MNENKNLGREENAVYHAPYVMPVALRQNIRVYVQQIRAVGGVQVPPGSETEKNANMGTICFWLREDAFDNALERFNQEMRGRITCEKGYAVIPKGTTIWRVLSWDDEDKSYFPFEVFGTFRSREEAEMAARDEYNYDRNKLAVDSGVGMDKVGLPEAAFVDFTKPQTYRKVI